MVIHFWKSALSNGRTFFIKAVYILNCHPGRQNMKSPYLEKLWDVSFAWHRQTAFYHEASRIMLNHRGFHFYLMTGLFTGCIRVYHKSVSHYRHCRQKLSTPTKRSRRSTNIKLLLANRCWNSDFAPWTASFPSRMIHNVIYMYPFAALSRNPVFCIGWSMLGRLILNDLHCLRTYGRKLHPVFTTNIWSAHLKRNESLLSFWVSLNQGNVGETWAGVSRLFLSSAPLR